MGLGSHSEEPHTEGLACWLVSVRTVSYSTLSTQTLSPEQSPQEGHPGRQNSSFTGHGSVPFPLATAEVSGTEPTVPSNIVKGVCQLF